SAPIRADGFREHLRSHPRVGSREEGRLAWRQPRAEGTGLRAADAGLAGTVCAAEGRTNRQEVSAAGGLAVFTRSCRQAVRRAAKET
ncbi:hypothetical protein ACFV0W_04800, partial [Streptomyces anulatus]